MIRMRKAAWAAALGLACAGPAAACQGVWGKSAGSWAFASKAALDASVQTALAGAPEQWERSLREMAERGEVVFVPAGTKLCATERAEGWVRVEVRGRPLVMASRALLKI